jgi:hypothetical protein
MLVPKGVVLVGSTPEPVEVIPLPRPRPKEIMAANAPVRPALPKPRP